MEQHTVRINGWLRAGGTAVEGLCLLWWLLPVLIQLVWLQQGLPLPHTILLPLGAAALQGLLLSPWRLSRVAFYCRIAAAGDFSFASLAAGWRLWGRAVAWRWHLWWRRAAVLPAVGLPAAILWSYGETADAPLLWLPLGGAALLLGLAAGAAFLCRYAAAPLLMLQGCPAGAAMGLSVRVMRGHIREYINFLGQWSGRLAACLLIVPAVWMLPRFHAERAALLIGWGRRSVLSR